MVRKRKIDLRRPQGHWRRKSLFPMSCARSTKRLSTSLIRSRAVYWISISSSCMTNDIRGRVLHGLQIGPDQNARNNVPYDVSTNNKGLNDGEHRTFAKVT
jgi:hypothetical protein